MTMNPSDTLNRAADLIEERGWVQGLDVNPYVEDGPFCASTAMRTACPEQHVVAYYALASYLGASADTLAVVAWNDRRGRTASEVIEVLRACAVIEASREREAAEVTA